MVEGSCILHVQRQKPFTQVHRAAPLAMITKENHVSTLFTSPAGTWVVGGLLAARGLAGLCVRGRGGVSGCRDCEAMRLCVCRAWGIEERISGATESWHGVQEEGKGTLRSMSVDYLWIYLWWDLRNLNKGFGFFLITFGCCSFERDNPLNLDSVSP